MGADVKSPEPAVVAQIVRLSDVVPEKVGWLWPGRIPLGKLTLLDGDPGLGKSATMLDLAARISVGGRFPDGFIGPPGGVVVLSAEDGLGDTIRPRLAAAGADLARIVALTGIVDNHNGPRLPMLPADIPSLSQAILQVQARLVIIDPLMCYLDTDTNSYRDQDVRRALAPLAKLAEDSGAAIVVIRHLNKTGNPNPLYRGGGSIGIIGQARSALLTAPDPADEEGQRRVLAVVKCNLAAPVPSLAYRLAGSAADGTVMVVWEGTSEHTAAALLAVPQGVEERDALSEAQAFLMDALQDGPQAAEEVKTAARRAGIAERTLERARHRAGIVTRRQGFGPGAVYVWSLHARQKPPCPPSLEYGVHGEHGAHEATETPATGNGQVRASSPEPCRTCGGTDFWANSAGRLICQRCHPRPRAISRTFLSGKPTDVAEVRPAAHGGEPSREVPE